jgi:hypothetical protein
MDVEEDEVEVDFELDELEDEPDEDELEDDDELVEEELEPDDELEPSKFRDEEVLFSPFLAHKGEVAPTETGTATNKTRRPMKTGLGSLFFSGRGCARAGPSSRSISHRS